MQISPIQITLGRTMLKWSQSHLAEVSGVSEPTIINLEKDTSSSRVVSKVISALEAHGIEFTDNDGVKRRTDVLKIYKGKDEFRVFYDDLYLTARDIGGDISMFNGAPDKLLESLGPDWYDMHRKRMLEVKDKYAFKIILNRLTDDQKVAGGIAEYKELPKQEFHEDSMVAYGEKIAFIKFATSGEDLLVRVIKDKGFAESFRTMFKTVWESA